VTGDVGFAQARQKSRLNWKDVLALFFLAITACWLTWNLTHKISVGLRNENAGDVWFEGDVSRVFYNMSARNSDQSRSSVHPIFALVAYPACLLFHKVAHLSYTDSADAFLAFTAAAWTMLMYLVLRRLNFDHVLATFGTLMGLASSAAILFFSVPETYSLASVSILGAVLLFLTTKGSRWEEEGAMLASASSLSITVTNWTLGLLLTYRRRRLREWLQLSANAFLIITLLWSLQKALMPTAEFFTAVAGERHYVHRLSPGVFLHTGITFVFHSVIAPAVQETSSFGETEDPIGPVWNMGLTFQNSWPGSGSGFGAIAAVLWIALLILGTIALIRERTTGISKAILIYLVLQFLLHVLYGVETFMYALDWMPILILVAVYGFQQLGRARWPAIILFTAVLAINNGLQFQRIADLVNSYNSAHPLAPPSRVEEMR
jgi:hypothetical protein